MGRACDEIQKKLLIKMNFLFALVFDPAERERAVVAIERLRQEATTEMNSWLARYVRGLERRTGRSLSRYLAAYNVWPSQVRGAVQQGIRLTNH